MRVSGQITDNNGQGLYGATVVSTDAGGKPYYRTTGGLVGTSTGNDGWFDLADAVPNAYLKVSFLGFTPALVPVKPEVFVSLKEGSNELPEATVPGKKTGSNNNWLWLLALGIAAAVGLNSNNKEK